MTVTELNLALFVCDTPPPDVYKNHGTYINIFDKAFSKGGAKVNWEGFNLVKMEYPTNVDKYDGIIIINSMEAAYNDKPWILKLVNFIQDLRENHKAVKLIGICFGHQVINRSCGGAVQKNPSGWEFGHTEVVLTPDGQKFFDTDRTSFTLYEAHQDHVYKLPPGFRRLGTTDPHTHVQLTASEDGQILTSQGHPELNHNIIEILMTSRCEEGILSEEFTNERLEKLKNNPAEEMGTIWMIKNFIKFFRGELSLK
ncbi:hypothetical protein DFQ28_004756 [Apophysomyces sp. BC1034]|nr:hypothetical protein DFQ30_010612 [Apophysomyces sp. BC1015]KAG0180951.1 hypothetical protein DFQ29_009772 [Apophysomyces sp. BC1021]KAG0188521.1 hypothetical protein DFQ28_004756 [Apophysomyces sp. BC1034]